MTTVRLKPRRRKASMFMVFYVVLNLMTVIVDACSYTATTDPYNLWLVKNSGDTVINLKTDIGFTNDGAADCEAYTTIEVQDQGGT